MEKKEKKGGKSREKGGKEAGGSFTFLGTTFGSVRRATVKRHLIILVLLSLATKGLVVLATMALFRSFFDLFDINYYLENALLLLQGQIPYISYSFDYPPLVFVPIGLALIPAVALQSGIAFAYSFQFLMILCDLGTLLCVYFIALKVWDERTAWFAGLIYATAFSAAYFVLTKYDAFPTLLLMGAVLFTVYGMKVRGYASATLGFFAKLFPAVAFPFLVFHNARTSSPREEIITAVKVFLPFFVVLVIPLLILRPESVGTYLFASGAAAAVYANTATYTLSTWLQTLGLSGLSVDTVSLFMTVLLVLAILFLVWVGWKEAGKSPVTLLKLIACTIFAIVLLSKFRSPQYILWFTPLLALLVAGNPLKTGLFYLTQALAYIEFPLMFGVFYVNLKYLNPVGSGWYSFTLVFFTLEYLALILLFVLVLRPKEGIRNKLRELARGT
jgi:hypothetical protein